MLETLSKIFNPNKLTDAIINTGDALVFTDEEQTKMKLDMLKNFEPFKLAQRLLAFIFTVNFIVSFWVSVCLFFWYPTYFDGFLKTIATFNLGWIMMAIVSFYFGSGFVNTFKGLKK